MTSGMIDLTSMGTLRCCVGEDNDPIDPAIVNLFALPTIGQPGDLSRNAGSGPGFLIFDLSVTREVRFTERIGYDRS